MSKRPKVIPIQLELNFGSVFNFKDAIRKVSRTNPQSGSVFQHVNGNLSNQDHAAADSKLAQAIADYVDPKVMERAS
jgi:hypothetical protein|tara:strand:- start:355 stop:585 length:231 start_codon:yes stop_codon:yes gene_type:complete